MTLVVPLTREYVNHFSPNLATITEMRRLQDLVVVPNSATDEQRTAFESWLQKGILYAQNAIQADFDRPINRRRKI